MELGQKLKQVRLESGLSQRQLCEGIVTRNMLSAIENGTAMPSLDTLRCLALRLGKPMGYFLEDEAVTSPNQEVMQKARTCYKNGEFSAALGELERYQVGDSVFEEEYRLLRNLCRMELARQALREDRIPYARSLLELPEEPCAYFVPALERERLLLLGQAGVAVVPDSDDRELLLRGQNALGQGDWQRCLQLLDAAEDQTAPLWKLLRAEAHFAGADYEKAARYFSEVEEIYPQRTVSGLEICYRELRDYEKAYAYACKQKL